MKILENISRGYKRIATGISIVTFLTILYFALIPAGSFAGSGVFSALSGSPIGSALVKLVDYPQYNATTNDITGEYTMLSVPEGTYKISASKHGYFTNTSTVDVVGGSTILKNFTLSIANNVFVPWTATNYGWTTPYVIANMGNANATVNISYYSAAGLYVGNYSLIILPGASNFVFRESTPSAATTDGSAVLDSDQPVSVLVDQFNNPENKFGAYEVDQSGSTEVYLPWTATTDGWTTPYVMINRGNESANITITYYNVTGSDVGSKIVNNLIPGASTFVFRESTPSAANSDGPAKLSSDQPISVLVDMFKNSQNKFGAYTPSSIADNKVFIPWTATNYGWTTPIKIVNRGSEIAVVNITYYNSANGQNVGNDSVSINPNQVVDVSRESTTAIGTDGSAVLNSTQPISVIVQQFNNGEGKFEVYTPAMTASNKIVIPWTATNYGWTTPFVIVNRGSANANIAITYYNVAGSNVGSNSVNNLVPGASTFVFRESTPSAATTDGSAVLVSDQPITVMVDQFNNGENKFGAYTPLG